MTEIQARDVAMRSAFARSCSGEMFCAMLEAIPVSRYVAEHNLPRPVIVDLSKPAVDNAPDAE